MFKKNSDDCINLDQEGNSRVVVEQRVPESLTKMTTNTPLNNGDSWTSGIVDFDGYQFLSTEIYSDQSGQLVGEWYDDIEGSNLIRIFTLPYDKDLDLSFTATPILARYLKYTFTNNSGTNQSVFNFRVTISNVPYSPQILRVDQFIPPNVMASLSRSVLVGKDVDGVYRNVGVNQFGVLPTADFLFDVKRGFYNGITQGNKFGRNGDIGTATTPEDIWNGGGVYTGFNPTSGDNIEVFSSSTSDVGALVTSGTATGGTTTTIVDSGAAFITDGVAIGDIVLNDTDGFHGIVSSVDSETQLSVYVWRDGRDADTLSPASGDSYRIATASSTGAAVMEIKSPLDSNYNQLTNEYVILNGTTSVINTGDFLRCTSATVILAGSAGHNVGSLTVRQQGTTANVMIVMPAMLNRTAIANDAVPAGKRRVIYAASANITRSGGTAGSAQFLLQVREFSGLFETRINQEITTANGYRDDTILIEVPEKSDIRCRINSVSDNSTIATADFNFVDYDEF